MQAVRDRGERVFVAGLVLFLVGHLIARPDLFPFSTYPMFSDRTTSVSWLQVEGPDGPIAPDRLGLATDYVANPNAKYGRRLPSLNPDGRPADPDLVADRVRSNLPSLGEPWVVVTQITVEALDDGTIRRSRTGSWRFEA